MFPGTKRFNDLDSAIKRAKWLREKSEDITTSTKELKFACNGGILVKDKATKTDMLPISDVALWQLCSLLSIPPQWVKTKQQMNDMAHLEESLNRHTKKLASTGIILRTFHGKKDQYVRAVFPDNTAFLDVHECLRILRAKIGKKVNKWPFIVISGFDVRALGLFKSAKIESAAGDLKKGFLPGIHAYASEVGTFPIGAELNVFRMVCENAMVIMDPDFSALRLKRREKVEGALLDRFREAIDTLRGETLKSFKRQCSRLSGLKEREVGADRATVVKKAGKLFGFSSKNSELVEGSWPYEQHHLLGLWNGITRAGSQLSEQGQFDRGHTLQKAGGRLVCSSKVTWKLLQECSYAETNT